MLGSSLDPGIVEARRLTPAPASHARVRLWDLQFASGEGAAHLEDTLPPVDVIARIATRGKLGLGESYTAGEWESDDLVALFELLLRNADTAAEAHPRLRRLLGLRPRLHWRNGFARSRRNIAYHYDLGNEDHILEIGCGWGDFARHAAETRGCRVTRITISREQAALARERDVEEIGEHYAETLRRWRASFHARIEDVRRLGHDRRFERTWDFYLAFCEAVFRMRALRDAQLLLARSGSER